MSSFDKPEKVSKNKLQPEFVSIRPRHITKVLVTDRVVGASSCSTCY